MLLLLALAGVLYQAVATRLDAQRLPEPGHLVDASGLRLQMYCSGAGSPTVVLEAGLGDVLEEWRRVQPEIAQFARVCSYDRAGYGGSDPGTMPRTSDRIASELHTALQNAGEKPPYVLVGHSFGGYSVRVFNGRFPQEVLGLVLVDATQEDQYRLLPKAWNTVGDSMRARYQSQARWAPLYINLGIARVWLRLHDIRPSYLFLQSKYLQARASELESIQVSAEQARAADHLADKPVVVLTAGRNTDSGLQSGLSHADFEAFTHTWIYDLQVRLAGLSRKGQQVILSDSGHDVPTDRPDAVVKSVRELCQTTRP